MNNRSFFKLPSLFIAIYFFIVLIFMVITQISVSQHYYDEIYISMFVAGLINLLFPLCLYFMIAVFCCNRYRLHTYSSRGIQVISVIAIILFIIQVGWGFAMQYVLQYIYSQLIDTYNRFQMITMINIAMTLVKYIVCSLILIGLFKLFAASGSSNREPYLLDATSGHKLYASLFSMMLMTLSLLGTSLLGGDYAVVMSLRMMFDNDYISILYLPIFIVMFLIHYFLIYLVTKNCFKRIYATVKAIPLFKSFGFTVLFVFLGSIVLGIILGIFVAMILSSSRYYYSLPPSIIFVFIFGLIMSYVILFVSARLGVRLIFGDKEQRDEPPVSPVTKVIVS